MIILTDKVQMVEMTCLKCTRGVQRDQDSKKQVKIQQLSACMILTPKYEPKETYTTVVMVALSYNNSL